MGPGEYAVWLDYYRRHGFPADRLELTVARAGAAVCGALGVRRRVKDLLPPPPPDPASAAAAVARLATLPGVKVSRVSREEFDRLRARAWPGAATR